MCNSAFFGLHASFHSQNVLLNLGCILILITDRADA